MERVLILNEQSALLYPSVLTDSLKMDYPFQIAFVQPPPPQRKNQRRGVCGGGGDCAQANLRRITHLLALVWKRRMTKFPCPVFLMIAKDCTERLSAVALSIGLIIQRGSCFSGHVDRASFFSDTPPKCLHRDCVGRRRTGTRHSNVYLRVREKQGIVVYRQRVYKQWHL